MIADSQYLVLIEVQPGNGCASKRLRLIILPPTIPVRAGTKMNGRVRVNDLPLSVHTRWKGDVAKQAVGKPPAMHEPIMKCRGIEELADQLAEGRIT